MAGRRRRRRRLRRGHPRQARPPLPPPEDPSPLESNALREIAVAESPSKNTCHALRCTTSSLPSHEFAVLDREVTVAESSSKKTRHTSSSTCSSATSPDIWADLLDSLLLQIIVLFSSFHDLLAFIGTCRSWRAVLSALPPAFTFNIPPLHLQPDGYDSHPRRRYIKHRMLSNTSWQLVDPVKQTSSHSCSAPRNLQVYMHYLGCSYGYLIFYNLEQCLLVNVYSGATVQPPKLKFYDNHNIYYAALVAPINLSNSHLLFCSRSSMFKWQVGSNFWSEHPLGLESIIQIVSFKGEIFAVDSLERIHRIQLEPQLSMQEVAVVWDGDMLFVGMCSAPWLVVCGDMLLLVHFSVSIDISSELAGTFNVFRLDFQVEPAKWVKVDDLGDNALFVSIDRRNPTFSCLGPEKWGGKRNCIYIANPLADSGEPWNVVEVGQVVLDPVLCVNSGVKNGSRFPWGPLQNLWVLPSFVYGVGQ